MNQPAFYQTHKPFLLLLVGYFLLSLLYNDASPIFEPPDEATHYRYIKYLLDHRALPTLIDGPNRQEVWGLHQPPLYFMVSALLAAPFELHHPNDYLARNPHVNLGYARRPGNKNYYLHTPAEDFPYRGFPLVVRYLRLLSTLCGAATLLIVYAMGLTLFQGQKSQKMIALIAPTLMTLHPEFVFITNAITNEPLNILLMTAGLWGCLRLIQQGPSRGLALFLGLVAGAIAIAKMTGLALILLIVIAMLISALRKHSALGLWQLGIIVVGLMLLVGGWWYGRNAFIYGDPWQAGMYRDFYSAAQAPLDFWDWYGGILAGEVSFWAAFGWLNIVAPEWIYTFYKTLLRLGLLGLLIHWLRSILARSLPRLSPPTHLTSSAPLLLLLASPLISSLILSRLIATEGGIQGRQLLPALPALALLLVIGYRALIPRRLFRPFTIALGICLTWLTLAMPLRVIAPTYALPPHLTERDLPADLIPLDRGYGDQIRLLGYTLPRDPLQPGQLDAITLYWQATQPIKADYTTFVHALGRGGAKVGEYNGYAGRGTLPPSAWPVGAIIKDRVEFLLDASAQTPTLLRLNVGFFDANRLDLPPLAVYDAQGNEVSTEVARQILVREGGETNDEGCREVTVDFGDNIHLRCYRLEPAALHLTWRVSAPPTQDYTLFIQLWQADRQVAGFDGPPFNGEFPTHLWQPEHTLIDTHPLDLSQLSPDDYRLLIGLYHPTTLERLPAFDAVGNPLPDFAVDLGTLKHE